MRRPLHMAVLVLAASGAAGAEGVTGYLEENYSHASLRSTDVTGHTDASQVDELSQRYHLNLDHGFWPFLRLNAGGIFEQVNDWATGTLVQTSWSRTANAFGTLTVGGPMLSAGLGYNYRSERQSTSAESLILEDPSFVAAWRPAGLPSFNLRVENQHIYDTAHLSEDISTASAILTSVWQPLQPLTLLYSATYTNPDDRILLTDSKLLTQLIRGDFQGTFGTTASISGYASFLDRLQKTTVSPQGGEVIRTQTPVAGFSLIDRFPATPDQDTLALTPALVDGNLTTSAAIDLGTSVRLSGDRDARELGVQFADAVTRVSMLYVWVNQELPTEIWSAFQWTAWQSDDNLRWTQVPVTGAVAFGVLQNRFEIPIRPTQARYVKVVTAPLDPAVTIDRRFSDIFVTELQVLLVTRVSTSTGWQGETATTLNLNARTQVLVPELAYDFSGNFVHGSTLAGTQDQYVVTNGLTYTRRLSRILLFSARGARVDQDQSRGHESGFLYSASLAANELPALSHSLVYSGQTYWTHVGFTSTNSLSLYNRAIPYRGIGVLLGAVYSLGTAADGQVLRSLAATATVTVQPHAGVTISGLLGHSGAVTSGGSTPRTSSVTNRVEGSVSYNPVPAIYLSGTLSRITTPPSARTLANGSVALSPFPRGDLQLSVSYTETYQEYGSTERLFVPAVRWNIRPATLLTVSYTWLHTTAEGARTDNRTFAVNFQTTL